MTDEVKAVDRNDLIELLRSIKDMMEEDVGASNDPSDYCPIEIILKDERSDIFRPLDKILFRLESGDMVRDAK